MKVYDCRLPADRERGIEAAVAAAKRGDLVVLPTDTLYGLGCDAFKKHSVSALLRAKGRGRDMPVAVLIGSAKTLDGLVHRVPKAARALAEAFWPGGLTVIVNHATSLKWDLGDTGGTVALRMPLHPVALEVLREVGPMAVSSANKTGEPRDGHRRGGQAQLGYSVKVYLDAGPLPGRGSLVHRRSHGGGARLLRAGAVPVERLRAVVPDLVVPPEAASTASEPDPVQAGA